MATAARIPKAQLCPLLYQSDLDARLPLVRCISRHHLGRSTQYPSVSRPLRIVFGLPALLALRSLLLPLHSGVVAVLQSSAHARDPRRAALGHYAQGRSMKIPIPAVPGRESGLFLYQRCLGCSCGVVSKQQNQAIQGLDLRLRLVLLACTTFDRSQ